jgi:hypothetical protein
LFVRGCPDADVARRPRAPICTARASVAIIA